MSTSSRQSSGSEPAGDPPPRRDALASLRIERPHEHGPRRWRRRWFIWASLPLVAIVVFIGYRVAVSNGWDPPDWPGGGSDWVPDVIQNRPQVRLVKITVQKGRSADAVVVATGYLESRRQARIGARAPGRIDVINFEEGSRVNQDEVLAILEHADLEASLAATNATVSRAKASLAEQEIAIEQAERNKNRAELLWRQKSIAEAEYDEALFAYQSAVARKQSLEAEIELAIARRDEAEQLKENMFIRAPFDGTVISKDAEVGESIMPGGMGAGSGRGSVATIADLNQLDIECDVKEDFISRITESQPAEVSVDAVPQKRYQGRVYKIIPMGDRARATIKVIVEILDVDELLFPEMSGTVYFLPDQPTSTPADDRPRMFCPTSAVTTGPDGAAFVWIVDQDGKAQKIAVTTVAQERDGIVEILDGVTGRERLIANPQSLTDGESVKVVE